MFTHVCGSLSSSSSSKPCFRQTSWRKSSCVPYLHSTAIQPRRITPRGGSLLTLPFEPRRAAVVGRVTLDGKDDPTLVQQQEEEGPDSGDQTLPTQEVVQSIKVLKDAAKTRKVKTEEVLSALSVIEKSKLDPSRFLETLGGSESPGRTWMLVFTAENKIDRGRYFPITAIQRFDAAGKRIENGVFFGPLGYLTFEGRFSWKKRMLSFVFERVRVKVGPFNPLEIGLGQQGNREPNTKDPFFIWFYIDEEIAVARGRSGGTAFWCRCRRVVT